VAPAAPGDKADWLPANKSGFGTSHTTLSKVWFTLEGGRLSEVYYPRLDTPSVRNLDFMITDGQSFAARAQDASASTTRLVARTLVGEITKANPTAANPTAANPTA
jgi:glucoamylase